MDIVTKDRRHELPFLLVNPPLTDPTCPYHSISYLIAAASAVSFGSGRAIDANIDALNHLVAPEQVAMLLTRAQRCIDETERKSSFSASSERW